MDIQQKDISELTTLMFAAALDRNRWTEFLERLHQVSGGVKTHIFGHDTEANTTLGILYGGYAPNAVRSFDDYYSGVNPWVGGFASGATGAVMHSQEMCLMEDVEKTEFYRDWVLPNEDIIGGGGSVLFNDAGRALFIGGNIRRKDIDLLENRWMQLVTVLTPHLQQAFEINRVLEGKSLELRALEGGSAAAVLVVNRQRRMCFASANAENMLEDGAIVRLDSRRRLSFTGHESALAFKVALKAMALEGLGFSSGFNVLDRVSGARYSCRTALLVPDGLDRSPLGLVGDTSEPCLLITIRPESAPADLVSRVSRNLGLSSREAQVAVQLAEGQRVTDIAQRHEVSVHTVRNQLKSAKAKLGVRRQTQLVRRVLEVAGRQ